MNEYPKRGLESRPLKKLLAIAAGLRAAFRALRGPVKDL